jgi:hypothetical protein
MRPSDTVRRRRPPPFFRSGEGMRLVSLLTGLVVILFLMGSVSRPGSMNWMFAGPRSGGEGPTPIESADEKLARVEFALAPQPRAKTAVPPPDPPGPGQVNPLGLIQIDECRELIPAMLESLRDREGINRDEQPALDHLLAIVATTPPDKLAESVTEPLYQELFSEPAKYRGQPVRIRGVLRSMHPVDVGESSSPYGIGRRYQAWLFPPDQWHNPIRVMFLVPPERQRLGDDLNDFVSIDGRFAKLYAYTSSDGKRRAVPLVVGYELKRDRPPDPRDRSLDGRSLALVIGVVGLAGLGLMWFAWRPRPMPIRRAADLIDPEFEERAEPAATPLFEEAPRSPPEAAPPTSAGPT